MAPQRLWENRAATPYDCILACSSIRASGHQPPVAVTSKFLVPSGIEWLFGDQVDRENFRTWPEVVAGLSSTMQTFLHEKLVLYKAACVGHIASILTAIISSDRNS